VQDLTVGQPYMEDMLHAYEDERTVIFKDEAYLVRNNGAVLRRLRSGARRRKLDELWTFGTLNKHSGYLVVAEHVVHQIVASAFHGVRPSAEHVVDHIDTNRMNNRADNLRWVTRLENVLLNPITYKRIVLAYGSIEAFFENPGACIVPNLDWMRTVTKEQAQESRKRLLEWVEKGQVPNGGLMGDWLFKPRVELNPKPKMQVAPSSTPRILQHRQIPVQRPRPATEAPIPTLGGQDTPSLTQGAFQRKWRTPSEFPQCPARVRDGALDDYLKKLVPGIVFSKNQYGDNTVVAAEIGPDKTLSVVCSTNSEIKGWARAKVYIEDESFCHESGGMFFEEQGAMKAHYQAIGDTRGETMESFDDYGS
jgi:HNH endonuclease